MLDLDKASKLVAEVDVERRADLRVRIATHRSGYLGYAGRLDEVEACLSAEQDQLPLLTDDRLRAIYLAALGYTHSLVGHCTAASRAAEQALAAAHRAEDRRTERRAYSLLSYEAAHSGRYRRGLDHGRTAVAMALVPETDPEHAVLACYSLALNQLFMGDCHAALASLGIGSARSEANRIVREHAFVMACTTCVHAAMGEHRLAVQASERALALASDVMSRTLVGTQRLLVHVVSGGGAAAFRWDGVDLAGLLRRVEDAGNRHALGMASLYAGRAARQDGKVALACEHAQRAKLLFEAAGDPRGLALASIDLGLAQDAGDGRQELLSAAIETLERLGARLDWADAQLALAQHLPGPLDRQRVQAAIARYRALGLPKRASAAAAIPARL